MAITTTFEITKDINTNLDSGENPSFGEIGTAGIAYVADIPGTFVDALFLSDVTGDQTEISLSSEASSRSIAQLADGGFIVAGDFGDDVLFVRINAAGLAVDGGLISSSSGSTYRTADVTALDNGGFAIASILDVGPETDPRLHFFDENGASVDFAILDNNINTSATGIKVATLSNGNVAVAYTLETRSNGETDVFYAIYEEDGTVVQPPAAVSTSGTINQDVSILATGTGFSIFYESNSAGTGGIDIQQHDFDVAGTKLSVGLPTHDIFAGASFEDEFNPAAVLLPGGLIALSYESDGDVFVKILSERSTGPVSDAIEINGGALPSDPLTDSDITTFVDINGSGLQQIIVAAENSFDGSIVGEILDFEVVQTSDAADDQFTPTVLADSFVGGDGIDTVNYSGAATAIAVDLGSNSGILGALGDSFSGIENLRGSAFNDSLTGDAGDNTIEGRGGFDRVYGGAGDDFVEGGNGRVDASDNVLYGGAGNDVLGGGQGADTMYGGIGNDGIFGGRGDDVGYGGAGEDLLNADGVGDGVDTGPNALYGGADNDRLIGGDAADYLDGGTGSDSMTGGRGNDFFIVDDAGDIVNETLAFSAGGGIDTVRSFVDYVQPTNIELVRLGNLDDTDNLNATGNDAPGTLVGNAGDNTLTGRGGNDQINGNDGDDVLIGNTGRDTLVGGEGADTFIYTSISESRTGSVERDVINGFDRGQDLIDLSGMDANLGGAGDASFTFVGTSGFSGEAGELRLQGLGGANAVLVEGDLRGDGEADFQVFVNLTTVLDADDFIL